MEPNVMKEKSSTEGSAAMFTAFGGSASVGGFPYDLAFGSSTGTCAYGGFDACRSVLGSGSIGPIFVSEDKAALLLQQLTVQLRDLLSKIVLENYTGLPDAFDMPPLPTKRTKLRVVRRGPSEFRFVED